ncbi:MAG: heme lyase CcmF/NrfE family subunit, partial [Deltaproteobacteria bacterium]|nr:heme lyase CcmF/NrfE family subunit [Deltaproteobacteria bacterium]
MSPIVIIGNLSVGLALGFSLFGIFLFYAARRLESENAGWWARASVYANFFLMTVANLAMIYALLHDDFGVSYVAHVGSRETPRWVSAISLWSSLEGSLLLWGWVLSAFSAACLYRNRETHLSLISWVGLVLLIVQIFFYLLLALPANPFLSVNPPPLNGPGPNPLLQN